MVLNADRVLFMDPEILKVLSDDQRSALEEPTERVIANRHSMELNTTALQMINGAHGLSEGTDNAEYVRGQAELIAQLLPCHGEPALYEHNIELITKLITE